MALEPQEKQPSAELFSLEGEGELTVARILAPKLYAGGSADVVGRQLLRSVRAGEFHLLLIDFSRVEVLSSAFLGTLVVLQQTLRRQGGRMRIFGLHETLEQTFEIARLRDLFGIDPDEETARFEIARH